MKRVFLLWTIICIGAIDAQAQVYSTPTMNTSTYGGNTLQPSTLSPQYSQTQPGTMDFRPSSGNQSDTINDYINRRTSEMLNNNNASNPNNPANPNYYKYHNQPVNSATPENQYTPLGGSNGNLNNTNVYRP